ncbi:MAG: TlpA family protein disulfide reductase [Bacteroidetes bacterium]|nr:TlpA family protein disulfide reductase [Bacteroidota bacterium]
MGIRWFCITVLVGLWGWANANSQQVSISGKNPDYRGANIRFTIPGHPFLNKPHFSKTITCDSTGAFSLEFEPGSESNINLLTGVYEASLHIEPGMSYEVQLPLYRELPYTERISPFFEPVRVPLRVPGNPSGINMQIFRFDSMFNSLNEEVILARRRGREPMADTLIGRLDQQFSTGTSTWFKAHMQYKKGILKLNEGKTKLDQISQDYLGMKVNETHPAYLELFGAMFKDFLVYYNRTKEGEGIRHHINRTHNLDSLRSIVTSHPAVTSDTMGDLILLQELPTLFYRGDFHKEAILILLDSLKADPVNPVFARYAKQERDKLSSLLAGYPPPDFRLPDTEGTTWSPADFKGKYTYLMFCTPDRYGCMMEYPFLNSYISKHTDYLEVVTIMVAEQPDQVTEFMERNQYHWRALYYGGENGILDNYLVKAFPVAYLIGPDGKIILSPAPLPTDGFEQQLFRIMRSRGDI